MKIKIGKGWIVLLLFLCAGMSTAMASGPRAVVEAYAYQQIHGLVNAMYDEDYSGQAVPSQLVEEAARNGDMVVLRKAAIQADRLGRLHIFYPVLQGSDMDGLFYATVTRALLDVLDEREDALRGYDEEFLGCAVFDAWFITDRYVQICGAYAMHGLTASGGGLQPNGYAFLFDTKTGEILSLFDLFTEDAEVVAAAFAAAVAEGTTAIDGNVPYTSMDHVDMTAVLSDHGWFPTEEGIVLLLNPYNFCMQVDGVWLYQEALFPWECLSLTLHGEEAQAATLPLAEQPIAPGTNQAQRPNPEDIAFDVTQLIASQQIDPSRDRRLDAAVEGGFAIRELVLSPEGLYPVYGSVQALQGSIATIQFFATSQSDPSRYMSVAMAVFPHNTTYVNFADHEGLTFSSAHRGNRYPFSSFPPDRSKLVLFIGMRNGDYAIIDEIPLRMDPDFHCAHSGYANGFCRVCGQPRPQDATPDAPQPSKPVLQMASPQADTIDCMLGETIYFSGTAENCQRGSITITHLETKEAVWQALAPGDFSLAYAPQAAGYYHVVAMAASSLDAYDPAALYDERFFTLRVAEEEVIPTPAPTVAPSIALHAPAAGSSHIVDDVLEISGQAQNFAYGAVRVTHAETDRTVWLDFAEKDFHVRCPLEEEGVYSIYAIASNTPIDREQVLHAGAQHTFVTAVLGPNSRATVERLYRYHLEDGYAVIDQYIGDEANVTVADTIEGMPVTHIASGAFADSGVLETVTLPDTVLQVGSHAFSDCGNLRRVAITGADTQLGQGVFSGCPALQGISLPGNGHSTLRVVDGVLFSREEDTLFLYPAARRGNVYTVPEGTKTIANSAFADAASLWEITIASSVENLEGEVFAGCTGLERIYFLGAPRFQDDPLLRQANPGVVVFGLGNATSTVSEMAKAAGVAFRHIDAGMLRLEGAYVGVEMDADAQFVLLNGGYTAAYSWAYVLNRDGTAWVLSSDTLYNGPHSQDRVYTGTYTVDGGRSVFTLSLTRGYYQAEGDAFLTVDNTFVPEEVEVEYLFEDGLSMFLHGERLLFVSRVDASLRNVLQRDYGVKDPDAFWQWLRMAK